MIYKKHSKVLIATVMSAYVLQSVSFAGWGWFDSLLEYSNMSAKYGAKTSQNNTKSGDVDVYDDTPDRRMNTDNLYIFRKRSSTNNGSNNNSHGSTGDSSQHFDKPISPIPLPRGPKNVYKDGDVRIYDGGTEYIYDEDQTTNGNDYSNYLRRRPMTQNNPTTTTKKTTTTTKTETKSTTNTTKSSGTTVTPTVTKTSVGESYSPVVQVRAYEYNKLFGQYEVRALGSAILLANNQAITNAHVAIMEESNNPYYLELCITYNPEEAPICTTTAKVLRYNNTTTDLALIEYVPVKGMKTTTLGASPAISDTVIVHGYPVNGGDTITVSQGIVSGRQGSDYKIDATINHGNSGGGAFNKSGQLIGIPSYMIGDGNSIGYIIGIDTVKKFINKEIASTTVAVDNYNTFQQAAAEQQVAIGSSTISTTSYTAKANNNTTISYRLEHAGQGISLVMLDNKQTKSSILVRSHRIVDGSLNAKGLENIIVGLGLWEKGKYTTSTVTINGVSWTKVTPQASQDYQGSLYVHVSNSQVISVLEVNRGKTTNDIDAIINSFVIKKPSLNPITSLLPQIQLKASNDLIPVVGYSLEDFTPEWGLYSNSKDGSIPFYLMQDKTNANSNSDSSDLDELFEDGEAIIYKNKAGQRMLVMKNTSEIFSVGLVGASSEIGGDTRVFLSMSFYSEDMYPILGQFIGWLDTLSLGGTDSMEATTQNTAPSTNFFEHK